MPADRLPEFVAALLLVTSFTVIGWLALWAAFSTANWFVRTLVILTCLAPLLAATAYEAFIAFVLQSVLIVLAIQFGRWWTTRKRLKAAQSIDAGTENPRPPSWRFSILTLLQITALAAVGSWVALQLPKLNTLAWISVCHIAGVAAMAAMTGALLSVSKKKLLPLMAIVGCFLLGADRAWFDWFLPSLTSDLSSWPPEPSSSTSSIAFGFPTRPVVSWFFIPVAIALLTALFVSLHIRAFPAPTKSTDDQPTTPTKSSKRRRLARITLAALTLLVIAFPLCVLAKLLTLDPIPITTTANPNGHDDLIAAGKIVKATGFENNGFDYETASQPVLAAEVGKCGAAYDLVARGITKQCRAPVSYSSVDDLPMDDIIHSRTTARALAGKARLEELMGHVDASARANMLAIQFGNNYRRGGLIVEALVGMGCSGHGAEPLYKQRGKLSPQQLDDCIAQLSRLDADDEPYADVWRRDRAWSQRVYGWHGHLQQILTDLTDNQVNEFIRPVRGYQYSYWSGQARIRLLICELALTRYHQDKKHWPRSLDELVPKYLQHVPIDPLSSTGDTLKYRPTDDGYALYSLGPNCIDDNGAVQTDPEPAVSSLVPETGDLRLDSSFGPHNNGTSQSATTQSPPAETDPAP